MYWYKDEIIISTNGKGLYFHLQNPLQIEQQFRSKSHSNSGANRTVIPE